MDIPFIKTSYLRGEFLSLNITGVPHRNISDTDDPKRDVSSFQSSKMQVRRRMSGVFHEDLTSRDDVILAILSLLLLLVIRGMVTTILLRTEDGRANKFNFATKQIIEMMEDFKFLKLFNMRRKSSEKLTRTGIILLSVGLFILLLTFGIDVAILFLTDIRSREITNKHVSIRIIGPTTARWGPVRFNTRNGVHNPCSAINLRRVEQGRTRITACVSSEPPSDFSSFNKKEEEVQLKITSWSHEFGQDHVLEIGDQKTTYKGRVFFNLQDGLPRLMKVTDDRSQEDIDMQMRIVHKLFIAFLFNAYNFEIKKESNMTLERLKEIDKTISFTLGEGEEMKITELNGKAITSKTRRYVTSCQGIIPYGTPAFRFGQAYFRGSMAIGLVGPDEEDLVEFKGRYRAPSTVWSEEVRTINWLTLSIILTVSFLLLVLLRRMMHPTSTVEIADLFVKQAVGAELTRSPMQVAKNEKTSFPVEGSKAERFHRRLRRGLRRRRNWEQKENDERRNSYSLENGKPVYKDGGMSRGEYRYGAETEDEWNMTDEYTEDKNSFSEMSFA